MRHFLYAAAAVISLSAAAAPALAATTDYWSGFYVGVTLGGSWGDTSTRTSANPGNGPIVIPPADLAVINATDSSSSNDTGFTGGVEGGYNMVFDSGFFIGLETDFVAFDINQSKTNAFNSGLLIAPPVSVTFNQEISTDWLYTLRPRIGYVTGPWMFYGTAGLAVSNIKYNVAFSDTRTPPDIAHQGFDDTKTGWVAGLGAAMALTPNWSVKGEYLYTDLGNIRGQLSTPTGFVNLTSEAKITANILRLGVDYRF